MIAPITPNDYANIAKFELDKARVLKKDSDFKKLLEQQKEKKLKETTKDFESIFIYQMIKTMRKTVPKNSLVYGGLAEDIWQGFLDEEYAKIMAQNASFGLAEKLYNELRKGL